MTVDLSRLPAPDVVEALDFEAILAAMTADLRERWPALDALVESEPALKVLEACAYRELLVRQRVNEAARSVMLAFARGSDLDHLGALLGTLRHPGEDDTHFRARAQLSVEGMATAGSAQAYRYHALGADPRVAQAAVTSPAPGEVTVTVLSTEADGAASDALIAAVRAHLDDHRIRPLTDVVTVASARILRYQVEAALTLEAGPDAQVVRAAAEAAVRALVTSHRRLGAAVFRSKLIAALHVEGVVRVTLHRPARDVAAAEGQAPWAARIAVEVAP